jgi:hypothetical protein
MALTQTTPATAPTATGAKIRATEATQSLYSVESLRGAGEIPRGLFDLWT